MGVDTVDKQVRNPMGNGLCLPRTSTGDHQQRANVLCAPWSDAVFGCSALLWV
jgi:hypothetical protein